MSRLITRLSTLAAGAGLCLALVGAGTSAARLEAQTDASAPAMVEPAATSGAPALRRLTESQYRATIADVFASDVPIAGRFERGLREQGLIAIGTSMGGMSPFSFEQYDISARSIAADVTSEKRRAQFVPCKPKAENAFDAACATKFIDSYGLKLFRRPLTRDEQARFLAVAKAAQVRLGGFHQGLEFALVGMLQSPHFLMRMERMEKDPARAGAWRLDAWSRAARLSYFLTNSTPDDELLRAAGAGDLDRPGGLQQQVDRLLASPRVEAAVRAFFWDMLQFDGFNDLFKDPSIYPAYNSNVARDAQEQTLRTIVSHLVTDSGDYRDLFTTRKTWLTRPLGVIYRVPVATRNGWEQAEYSAASQRSGILTDISMLALHSHPGRSSATLRGKSLREILLCQKVPDPPANVNFTAVDQVTRPGSTARMRLAEHNANPVCAGCHKLTDPIGLTLESFDGAGTFRAKENGVALDLSGSLSGTKFTGAQGLGKAFQENPATPTCLVDKLYRSAIGRATSDGEAPYLDYLGAKFAANGYRLPALMRAIALSRTFYAVTPPPAVADGKKSTKKEGSS
ncbi:DUF1592 domain-containing protein [Novosphingobium aquae]|uniref:DUF1592 domain-containing protein n=1 Tax=Novosphingobium aquae TaxID=3133435 RepID=A0ABU8S822_9SPHN